MIFVYTGNHHTQIKIKNVDFQNARMFPCAPSWSTVTLLRRDHYLDFSNTTDYFCVFLNFI